MIDPAVRVAVGIVNILNAMPENKIYSYVTKTPNRECKYCGKEECKISTTHRRMNRCYGCLFKLR